MRLGIVSDTHGHVESTREAVRLLDSLQVERVLHCGDIGSAEVVEQFAHWPTDFVLGNCDHHPERIAAAIIEILTARVRLMTRPERIVATQLCEYLRFKLAAK